MYSKLNIHITKYLIFSLLITIIGVALGYHQVTPTKVSIDDKEYKTNNSDIITFLKAGYPGVNYTVGRGPEHYQQPTDRYINLDKESNNEVIYFPLIKGNTLIISNRIMYLLSCFIGILSLLWIFYMFMQKECTMKEFIITFTLLSTAVIGSALIGWGGSYIYNKVVSGKDWVELAGTLNLIFYLLCLIVVVAIHVFLYAIAMRSSHRQTLLLCGVIIFNLLNWLGTFFFISITYIFTVPLCSLFLYSTFMFLMKDKVKLKLASYLYIMLQGILILILYTPCIYLIYTAFLSSFLYTNTLLTALAVLPNAILCITIVPITITKNQNILASDKECIRNTDT